VSSNLDLIYGLPHQRVETFEETLRQVNEIRPERIAVYSFAHVPWMKGHQRCIPPETLPAPETKLDIFAAAIDAFTDNGYLAIGMDHFALPDDEMGRALQNGTLWRNFMGYTVKAAPDMVACGMSGIGNVAGGFFQNHSKLIDYELSIEAGDFAIERGYVLHGQDELRAHIITALMCAFRIDIPDVERRFGIEFWKTFQREAFDELVADGFVQVTDDEIRVVGNGRLFVRNVAMLFDERTRADQVGFSRTV
jgi:oxygen-independent coproporphyrinogen-3 oxidase